jgi:signal transduction histidine kinase
MRPPSSTEIQQVRSLARAEAQDSRNRGIADDGLKPKGVRRLVITAFGLIAAGVLGITVLAVQQVRVLQANAAEIVENMLTGIRLVGRLGSLVDKRRILVGDHIFATGSLERAQLENEIRSVEAEIEATRRAYEPWVTQPNEAAVWERTQEDLDVLVDPVAKALKLSRENRDAEARERMHMIGDRFARLNRDLERLISINDQGAVATLSSFTAVRRQLTLALLGLGLAALMTTLLLGRWILAQVTRRESKLLIEAQTLGVRNRELDAFARTVAHDLRGPLTGIRLATKQLETGTPVRARPREVIERSACRMEALVNDLLALAGVETRARGTCDPSVVVAQVQEELAPTIAAEHGTLRVEVEPAEVACSESLFHQTVTNLVENAFKYRRPDVPPAVEISGTTTNCEYELRIADNGVGMNREEAQRAFDPFYRSPRVRDRPGTGLGLSIVQRVAQATGGAISLDTSVGKGSTFLVRLPLAPRESEARN